MVLANLSYRAARQTRGGTGGPDWLSDKACRAYHHGFLENLTADPTACVFEIFGGGATAWPPARAA